MHQDSSVERIQRS